MSSHEPAPGELAPLSYVIIPRVEDMKPHAVWNWVLLAVRHDTTGAVRLQSVCGLIIHANPYPLHSDLCTHCAAKLKQLHAVANPAPDGQQLTELARITSTR